VRVTPWYLGLQERVAHCAGVDAEVLAALSERPTLLVESAGFAEVFDDDAATSDRVAKGSSRDQLLSDPLRYSLGRRCRG
jgi:hypothetical protein